MKRILLPMSLALVGWAGAGGAAEPAADRPTARRAITAQDLWSLERVGDPTLSPDGQWVVYTVTRFSLEKNRGNGDLWLARVGASEPPRRLTWNEGSDGSPTWSPDGQRLAFVSKRGDGPPQLYVLPISAPGEAEPITELPVAPGVPRWFPDGKRIGFLAWTWPDLNDDWKKVEERQKENEKDKIQAKTSENRLLRFWDEYKTDGRVSHLFVVDLETRKVTDLLPGSKRILSVDSLGDWDLAPDGREVAFSANSTEPPYATLNADVFVLPLDAEGKPGELRNLTAANPADDVGPRYSPDGRSIAYGRSDRPDFPSDFTHLALYDRRAGTSRALLPDWDGQPAGWAFSPGGERLYFHAEERGRIHLFRVPVAGGKPEVVVRGGTTGSVEVGKAAKGERLVFRRESITEPAQLAWLDLPGSEPKPLTRLNEALLAELDLGRFEDQTFAGAGGAPVHMIVVYPPGFDPKQKWPLLHAVHGGPHGAFLDQFHFRWNPAALAAKGHVVAMVNFHGSTGYGQAFADSIVGAHGDKPFDDIMKATDHLLAQGFIDEKRLAAAGGSYGGYLVSWILGHTDRFAALINHAGVYDLMAQFASDSPWGREEAYGAAPWTDPERIDRYSPSRFAKNFATPTLILHGELDYRVPYTQGINLYNVLQGKGVPSRIVVFPQENHWVLKPQSAQLWWKEVFDWLARYAPGGGVSP
jgi:dipeptidyl aminopeptidase/acylaminoacyl peptidase